MRLRLLSKIDDVRTSYWFVPTLMAFAAALLGGLMIWVDSGPGAGLLDGVGWYQKVKADGAREVLSTVAGSMITVAGVVFSITIVAIAYASSQYGPRVLTNFMGDRGNQFTLGTFIATFLYSLVVLRTIRGGDDSAFIPQISVVVAILLAICSIGVLIYFIHHVPQSIHVNNVIARIGRQLIAHVDDRFPASIGEPPDGDDKVRDDSAAALAALDRGEGVATIVADRTGYIQSVDDPSLMSAACEADLVVRLRYRPGEYIHAGRPLAVAWPAANVDEEAEGRLRGSYDVGTMRTPFGDLSFLIDELVEIAARALSTGVNDPNTANSCLDWLGAGLSDIARRRTPSPSRVDGDGKVRVVALPDRFEDVVARAFGGLRQYVGRDRSASLHALETIGRVAADSCTPAQLRTLADEAERLAALACEELKGAGRDEVAARAAALREELDDRIASLARRPRAVSRAGR